MHCSRRRVLRRGLEFHVCTINKSAHTKKVWKLIVCPSYIYIYIYISLTTKFTVAQSAAAEGYTVCISTEGARLPHPCNCFGYDAKQNWWWGSINTGAMGNTDNLLLPSLPGPLWSRMVASDRALSMGQIELKCVNMLNWFVWNRTVFSNESMYSCWTELFEIKLFWHLTV